MAQIVTGALNLRIDAPNIEIGLTHRLAAETEHLDSAVGPCKFPYQVFNMDARSPINVRRILIRKDQYFHLGLKVIVKIPFRSQITMEPEYLGRQDLRIHFHVISRPTPKISFVTEQIMNLERSGGVDSQFRKRQVNITGLHVVNIWIYDHKNDVREVLGVFAVHEQLIVCDSLKYQISILLKRRIFLADAVDPADQSLKTVRLSQKPALPPVVADRQHSGFVPADISR